MFGELIKGLLARMFPQEDKIVQIAEELLSVNEATLEKHGIVLTGLDMRRVDDWQQGLTLLGYKVMVDAQYGRGLAAAFRDFQRAQGAISTGLPDGKTIALLATALRKAGQKVYCPFAPEKP